MRLSMLEVEEEDLNRLKMPYLLLLPHLRLHLPLFMVVISTLQVEEEVEEDMVRTIPLAITHISSERTITTTTSSSSSSL